MLGRLYVAWLSLLCMLCLTSSVSPWHILHTQIPSSLPFSPQKSYLSSSVQLFMTPIQSQQQIFTQCTDILQQVWSTERVTEYPGLHTEKPCLKKEKEARMHVVVFAACI